MTVPYVMHRMGSKTRHCPCKCGGPLQAAGFKNTGPGAFTVLVPREQPQADMPVVMHAGLHATLPKCAE
eukprot:6161604-Prorocentrum_lima.AAC.1